MPTIKKFAVSSLLMPPEEQAELILHDGTNVSAQFWNVAPKNKSVALECRRLKRTRMLKIVKNLC